MIRFLVNANLSPACADHLNELGYEAHSVIAEELYHLSDPELMALAHREGYIVLTQDVGFAREHYRPYEGRVGVIVLRLRTATPPVVNDVLTRFLDTGLLEDTKIHPAGETDKTEMPVQDYNEALTFATKNWERYRRRYEQCLEQR